MKKEKERKSLQMFYKNRLVSDWAQSIEGLAARKEEERSQRVEL